MRIDNTSAVLLGGPPRPNRIDYQFNFVPPALGATNATVLGFVGTPLYREWERRGRPRPPAATILPSGRAAQPPRCWWTSSATCCRRRWRGAPCCGRT